MKVYIYSKVTSSDVSFPKLTTKVFTNLDEARTHLNVEKEKIKTKQFQGSSYYECFEHEDDFDRFEAYDGPEADTAFLKIEVKNI